MLLLNNQHLGMVVQWEDRFHEGNRATPTSAPAPTRRRIPISWRWPRASASAPGRSVSKGDLDAALEEMIDSKGPYVLDVLVPYQEHVLPMIPGGMTVGDMIKA